MLLKRLLIIGAIMFSTPIYVTETKTIVDNNTTTVTIKTTAKPVVINTSSKSALSEYTEGLVLTLVSHSIYPFSHGDFIIYIGSTILDVKRFYDVLSSDHKISYILGSVSGMILAELFSRIMHNK